MWILVGLAVAATLSAQSESTPAIDPDVLRLARIKLHMAETLGRMPNYTCTQTIERSRRAPKSRRFQLVDTIRLEVALVDGKELFSWPGAGKFEDRELREIVGGGTIGNGSFALHAKSVFQGRAPTFEFVETIQQGARKLLRYRYRVPRFQSGYKLRDGVSEGIAGYSGSFDVDAEALDLIRLEVIADDIPPHLSIQSARDEMYYARVAIGNGEFLLPQSSELVLISMDGTEGRNRVRFSDCRQYTGESTISFDEAPPQPDLPPPASPVTVELPIGLSLDVELTTPIGLQPPIIGTPFEGLLRGNARHRGSTAVPKGAIVRGRLLEGRPLPRSGVAVALMLFEVEFPGARAGIHAVPEEIGSALVLGGGSRIGVDKQGIIYMSGAAATLHKGTRMLWRIVPPNPSSTTGRQPR